MNRKKSSLTDVLAEWDGFPALCLSCGYQTLTIVSSGKDHHWLKAESTLSGMTISQLLFFYFGFSNSTIGSRDCFLLIIRWFASLCFDIPRETLIHLQ